MLHRPVEKYQHDNAPAHKAHLSVNFLARNRIPVLDWVSLSPDMAPIEHVCLTLDGASELGLSHVRT